MPPLAKNGCLKISGKLLASKVALNCGGYAVEPTLSKITSYAKPNPARMEVLPLLPGEYAIPTRGAKFLLAVFGALNVIRPGTLAMAFRLCKFILSGTPVRSQRKPRFKVKLGRMRQLSLT